MKIVNNINGLCFVTVLTNSNKLLLKSVSNIGKNNKSTLLVLITFIVTFYIESILLSSSINPQ